MDFSRSLYFPGLSDESTEIQTLPEIVHRGNIDYIQMRKLSNMSERYFGKREISKNGRVPMGILRWQAQNKRQRP